MVKTSDLHCRAFQTAIEVLGRSWNGLILGLLQERPLRFSELEEKSHGVGPKTLSARLRTLEASGIVARRVDAGPPVRVVYSLSAKGRAFGKVADAIHRWGGELLVEEPPARAHRSAEIRRRSPKRRGQS